MRIRSSEEREERWSFGSSIRFRFAGRCALLALERRRFKGIIV